MSSSSSIAAAASRRAMMPFTSLLQQRKKNQAQQKWDNTKKRTTKIKVHAFPPQPPRGPNGSPRGPPGRPSPPPSSSSSGPGKKPGGGLIIPGMEDFPTDVIPGMSPGGYAAGGGGKQGQTISMPGSQPGQQQFGGRPQTPPAGKEYDEESGALNPDTPMGGVKFGTSNAGGGGPRPTYLAPGEEMTGSFEQQFKPPPTFDDQKVTEDLDANQMVMMLSQRAGHWFQLAKYIPALQKMGYVPDRIFDETGIENKEQVLWQTWLATYASLKSSKEFPDELLSYFESEYSGAPCLSQINILPSRKRNAAAEFIARKEFTEDQARELVKSYEIRESMDAIAKDFGRTPGECLAFKIWRDIQELQRYEGVDKAETMRDRGLQYAETDNSRGRLESATEMFRMEVEGEVSNLAAAKAENAENRLMAVQPVNSVRLDFDEIEFRPIAVVGALSKLTTKAIKLAQVLEQVGANDPSNIFKTFRPQGTSDWMAVPNWEALANSKEPVATFVGDTAKELPNVEGLNNKAEPAMIIIDRWNTSASPAHYYLLAKKSSVVLSGAGESETVAIQSGAEVLKMEKSGASLTVLGRVVIAIRAPSMGGDGMTTDAPVG